MLKILLSVLPAEKKKHLRGIYFKQKKKYIETFFSYGPEKLKERLHAIGISPGDTILVHSSFSLYSGFKGTPDDLIDVFLRTIGPEGNLLMVSLPYLTSTYKYLQNLKCFDVNKTASRMGLLSELFRRRKDVLRSLHPTHPILARGPKAEWIIAHHEDCLYACGSGSPFEKLLQLKGKVFFFDTPFAAFTFFHYLEDMVRGRLSFSLYDQKIFAVPVIDAHGKTRIVKTVAFSEDAIKRRRFSVLEKEFWRCGLIKSARIGNTRLLLVKVVDAVSCTEEMMRRGVFFYATA